MHRIAELKFLLALALVLRLAFLLLAGVNAPLVGDELAYQQIAVNVAAGRGFVQSNNPFFPGQTFYAWQAPLYPLSLAALYLLFGPHPIIGKLFGILLGVATVYLTFDLARRVFPTSTPTQETPPSPPFAGSKISIRPRGTEGPEVKRIGWEWGGVSLWRGRRDGVAWLAAVSVAVYPGLLTNAHLLLSETLFTFLLLLAFDLIAVAIRLPPFADGDPSLPPSSTRCSEDLRLMKGGRGGVILILAAGALWGAATLTRGITLYFALPLVIWLAIKWVPSRHFKWRRFMQGHMHLPIGFKPTMAVVFAIAMVAVLVPWTIRNLTVFRQFVLLETKGGVNFWLGNSPFTPDDFIRNVWKTGVREPMLAALPGAELANDHAGYALGEAYVIREPLTFIARMPVKFADFWGFERNLVDAAEATRNGKAGGWNSPSKIAADIVSDAAYVIFMLLAVGGLIFAGEDRWKLLIGGFIVYFVFVHMVVFGDGRFHLPLIPFLALYAGWFIVNRAERVRVWGVRGLTAFAFGLVFAMVWGHEIMAAWGELRGGL